jgi:carbon storage regulator CsrA
MLVLTRKAGEQIIIGDNIKVTVVSVGPGRIKIGIEAPDNVSVDRAEIHARKQNDEVVGPILPPEPADVVPNSIRNRISDHLTPPRTLAAAAAKARTPRKPR